MGRQLTTAAALCVATWRGLGRPALIQPRDVRGSMALGEAAGEQHVIRRRPNEDGGGTELRRKLAGRGVQPPTVASLARVITTIGTAPLAS
jgi:hypothetical protein